MRIDWTKPLELMDGTPVRLAVVGEEPGAPSNPDESGDYYVVREDMEKFTRSQVPWVPSDICLICRPDGTQWEESRDRFVIRNRASDEWGAEIEVNGVRPDWLRDDDRVFTERGWSCKDEYTTGDITNWFPGKAIRLPADHPYYTATEKGFTYWPGGDAAPADWDGGDVLLDDGEISSGYSKPSVGWKRTTKDLKSNGIRRPIGYRRKPEASAATPTVDWTKPIEAVRKSDGLVVPVTFDTGPDNIGTYHTKECPNSAETNRNWQADGRDFCSQDKWFVRNRADTVTLSPLTAAEAEARMLDIPTLQELGLIVAEPTDRATELTREILAAGSETVGSKIAAQKYRDGRYDEKPRFIAAREIVARELGA